MSSLSSLHALPNSSSADVAPMMSTSSVAVTARVQECTRHALSSSQSRSIRSRWYSPHQSDQTGRPSSKFFHKVGPFDVIGKHLGVWGRETQLIFFILARASFSRMKTLYLASLMSDVLKPYNKQTPGGDSWNVDKPKKNGEDVSMGGPHLNVSGGNTACIQSQRGIG